MKITDVQVIVVDKTKKNSDTQGATIVHNGVNLMDRYNHVPIVRIMTDEGIEGISFGRDGKRSAAYLKALAQFLIGEDPMYPEKIWQKINAQARMLHMPDTTLGTADIAIWDIVGKKLNSPLYKVFGAYRDKVMLYASSGQFDNVEAYVNQVKEIKKRGIKAYKLHIRGIADVDIEVLRAVREEAGKEMILMHDPVGLYSRKDAMKVGRVLEELDYFWYEEPINDGDIQGLKSLRDKLSIPITSLEMIAGGIESRVQYILNGAVDIVRSDALNNGGITHLRKLAPVCEAFGMNLEIHAHPNTWANAANLQVSCAMKNCDFYEWVVPEKLWDFGVKENVFVDEDGYAHVPQLSGIGLEPDWDWIDDTTIEIL